MVCNLLVLCIFYMTLSPPFKITPDTVSGWALGICIDSLGKIWVFWEWEDTSLDCIFCNYYENGKWSEAIDFFPEHMYMHSWSGPVADKNNKIWLFSGDGGDIWGRYIDENGLGGLIYVPDFPSCDFWYMVTSDLKGNIWVAWTTDWYGSYPIFTSYYDGEKWSTPLRVTKLMKETSCATHTLFCDREGTMWILYENTIYTWEKDSDTCAISIRKFEGDTWSSPYVFARNIFRLPINLYLGWSGITQTKSEYVISYYEGMNNPQKLRIYTLNFSTLPFFYSTKIWEEDGSSYTFPPYLFTDKENRIWVVYSPEKRNIPYRKIYLRYFDNKWSEPYKFEIERSLLGGAIGPPPFIYDRFRERVWFTYSVEDTISKNGKEYIRYQVYVRYIDLGDIPLKSETEFYIFPSIITNRNVTMFSFAGIKEEISEISILDISGRKIRNLYKNLKSSANYHRVYWVPEHFPAGNYYIYLRTKDKKKIFKKLILIR